MTPEEIREFTERLRLAAIQLLEWQLFRKPDDLARRFGLPVPVVRYWWRNTDEKQTPVDQSALSPNESKTIRKATQTLEGWEKIKRYRPPCHAPLSSGKRCKRPVAIRSPEGWTAGALATRCRMHGGFAKRILKRHSNEAEDQEF